MKMTNIAEARSQYLKELQTLLIDAKETFEFIVESDTWEELRESSSAKEIISQIKTFQKTYNLSEENEDE
jgi:hypothetical protein